MNRTNIEWVKNPDGTQGYTWNPITGCLGPKGDGVRCTYCYACKLANGRLKSRYLANLEIAIQPETTGNPFKDPFYPRFWPEKITQPDKKRKPCGIFICDMSDLFGDWIPFEWQNQIFIVIRRNPQHRFYLLTKQPQNLNKWSPFPENCHVGVSVCNQEMYENALKYLAMIESKVKFLSIEPLLERINLDIIG